MSAVENTYFSPSIQMQQQCAKAIEISKWSHSGKMGKVEALSKLGSLFNVDKTLSGDGLGQIAKFVQTAVGLDNFTIDPVIKERSWTPSRAYWIRDAATKEKLLFLKTFATDDQAYLSEIYGLDFLSKVNGFAHPQIHSLGQCQIDNKPYFLLFESVVGGFSIQQYYNEVDQYALGSDARNRAVTNICQGVHACGLSLAKLHGHLKPEYGPLPQQVEDDMRSALNKAVKELECNPREGIQIDQLKQSVDEVIKKMKKEHHLIGVTHGDMKLANTFYDYINQMISLVHLKSLSRSLDSKGTPQELPSREYYRYMRSLILNNVGYALEADNRVSRLELLTQNELEKVKEAFQKGYVEAGGILPTPIEEDFALLRHNLLFVGSANIQLPEPDLTRLNDLLGISLDCLRKRLTTEQIALK